ncbi:MAG TPA: heat-inducible transcriptional repressor HrcA [Gaiellales bacterium]|nr:heat-inducible transcriptional repressor HrcA [Gaiellales bacterium]
MSARSPLTPRQLVILTHLVDAYIATGHPVGSKTLVELGAVEASSSTVRYELAELESRGLLDHPHTSAGRVPTDAGYRLYAESLLEQPLPPAVLPVDLSSVRSEVDTALRVTTEMLSQVTSLVALVSAPRLESTEIRHIEVLLLQPQVVMVVVITATGGVTKRIFPFPGVVDPKLAEWANAFLNEQLTGVRLGARMLVTRLDEPGLSPTEQVFLDILRPAFTELVEAAEQQLYVGGGARLLEEMHVDDLVAINDLVRVLEGRVGMLEMLRQALDSPRPYLRIGADHSVPYMRGLAMVAANYGLATRNLGTVSLIGPRRMDYAAAIRSVRGAAHALSEFVAEVYEE